GGHHLWADQETGKGGGSSQGAASPLERFVASLSGIVTGEDTPDGQRAFARACNNLNLVAPQPVIQALQLFQDEIRVSNSNQSRERHDQLLSRLLYEIRKDLGVWPKDSQDFKVGIWASGVRTNG